ncbi:MAG: hypothetical protein JW749_01560 [Sedimentisphaerales bacterium]|nr:hypothetical protein [Sedimentisphaerales bacterium]
MADFGIEEQGGDKPMEISHSPLNLGGGSEPEAAVEPEERPVVRDTGKKVSWPDRITGCKTFFAKLHVGAIDFLDEQVSTWLKDNPGVSIKMTNAVVGEIQAKKTEPNLIVTVWY